MLTNDELKKKILEILKGKYIPVSHNDGDFEENYFLIDVDFVDALIAAGIGDVKDLQVQVDSLEITNIALQAVYDDAEKDRLYWVDKYKEAEHRAEVAERALQIADELGGVVRKKRRLCTTSRKRTRGGKKR